MVKPPRLSTSYTLVQIHIFFSIRSHRFYATNWAPRDLFTRQRTKTRSQWKRPPLWQAGTSSFGTRPLQDAAEKRAWLEPRRPLCRESTLPSPAPLHSPIRLRIGARSNAADQHGCLIQASPLLRPDQSRRRQVQVPSRVSRGGSHACQFSPGAGSMRILFGTSVTKRKRCHESSSSRAFVQLYPVELINGIGHR